MVDVGEDLKKHVFTEPKKITKEVYIIDSIVALGLTIARLSSPKYFDRTFLSNIPSVILLGQLYRSEMPQWGIPHNSN
jgi:hypothetical protein